MSTEIAKKKDEITLQVMNKIADFEKQGELKFPSTYSPGNALKSAFLVISELTNSQKKPALEVCSKESIGNALLEMVTDGLSPIKNQCYFIVYGSKLGYQRGYQGDITIGKRDAEMKTVTGVAVFQKDEFEFVIDVETGIKKITKHTTGLGHFGKDIKGAYAIITFLDESKYVEVMDIGMIQQAWKQGAGYPTPAHKNFPDQQAIKTVKARACKPFINTTDDSGLLDDKPLADSLHTIKVNANQPEPEIQDIEPIDETKNELTEDQITEAIQEQDKEAANKNKPGF